MEYWTILRVISPDAADVHFKLYRTTHDTWTWNSGITKVEETDDHYTFHGNSGSAYTVWKDMYGVTGWGQHVFNGYAARANETGWDISMLDEDEASDYLEMMLK